MDPAAFPLWFVPPPFLPLQHFPLLFVPLQYFPPSYLPPFRSRASTGHPVHSATNRFPR